MTLSCCIGQKKRYSSKNQKQFMNLREAFKLAGGGPKRLLDKSFFWHLVIFPVEMVKRKGLAALRKFISTYCLG